MPTYAQDIAAGIQLLGEELSLVQQAEGTWDTATQTNHAGAITTTSTYGVILSDVEGDAGVDVRADALEIMLSKSALDGSSVTPQIGDKLVFGTTRVVILSIQSNAVMGYYHVRAKGVR